MMMSRLNKKRKFAVTETKPQTAAAATPLDQTKEVSQTRVLFPDEIHRFPPETNFTNLTLSSHHLVLHFQVHKPSSEDQPDFYRQNVSFPEESIFEFYSLTKLGNLWPALKANTAGTLSQSLPSHLLSARLPIRRQEQYWFSKICFSLDGLYFIIYDNTQFKMFHSDGQFLFDVTLQNFGIATTVSFVQDFILVLMEHCGRIEKLIYTMDGVLDQHFETHSDTAYFVSNVEWNAQVNQSTKRIETWNSFWIQRNMICSTSEKISQQSFPGAILHVTGNGTSILQNNVIEGKGENFEEMNCTTTQTQLRLFNSNPNPTTLLLGVSTKHGHVGHGDSFYVHQIKKYCKQSWTLKLECEWVLALMSSHCEIVDFVMNEKCLFVIFYDNQDHQYAFCCYSFLL